MTEIKLPECQQRSLVLQTGKGRGDFWLQGQRGGGGGSKRSKLKEHRSKRERVMEKIVVPALMQKLGVNIEFIR